MPRSSRGYALHTGETQRKDGRYVYTYTNINRFRHPKKESSIKNMGVQESQNCTVITRRMKHRRMRWSVKGANNLAKVLCRKENKELCSTIERYTDGLIFTAQMNEIIEALSAAKAPKTDGKGNLYVDVLRGHVALLDAATTASGKVFQDAYLACRYFCAFVSERHKRSGRPLLCADRSGT